MLPWAPISEWNNISDKKENFLMFSKTYSRKNIIFKTRTLLCLIIIYLSIYTYIIMWFTYERCPYLRLHNADWPAWPNMRYYFGTSIGKLRNIPILPKSIHKLRIANKHSLFFCVTFLNRIKGLENGVNMGCVRICGSRKFCGSHKACGI
jgi:hypothetical protein